MLRHFIIVPGDLMVRLSGGLFDGEGKVEINVMNEWRSVCADLWDSRDAAVVCRQLGYAGGDVVHNAYVSFGMGIAAVWLDNVECLGYESSLAECDKPTKYGQHDCDGMMGVAGVRCYGPGKNTIRNIKTNIVP